MRKGPYEERAKWKVSEQSNLTSADTNTLQSLICCVSLVSTRKEAR